MATSAAELLVEIGADLREFKKGMSDMRSSVDRAAQKMRSVGKTMSVALTAPLVGAAGAAIKTAGDFEESMAKINTLVGQSADQVEEWGNQLVDLGPEVGKSPRELADALFVVTSAGQRGAEAMQIVEQSAKAAALGLGQTRDIARSVTSAMNAYGAENLSASRATNVLLSTIREGNVEASSLAPVLGRVIGIASQMGVSFEEVGANIATFTRLGVGAEEAVTGLRSVMTQLLKPAEQAKEALAGVGLSAEQLRRQVREEGLQATLKTLVGAFEGNQEALTKVIPNVRALANVMGTAGSQGETYSEILQSVAKDTASVDAEFEKTSDNLNRRLARLKQSFSQLAIILGNELMPAATNIVDSLTGLAKAFARLGGSTQRAIVVIGGLVAVLGPLLVVVGTVISAFSAIAGVVGTAAAALGTLGAVVGGVAAAFGGVPPILRPVKALFTGTKEEADGLSQSFRKLSRQSKRMKKMVRSNLTTPVEGAVSAFLAFQKQTKQTGDAAGDTEDDFQRVKGAVLDLAGAMDTLKRKWAQAQRAMIPPMQEAEKSAKDMNLQIRETTAEGGEMFAGFLDDINKFAATVGKLGKALAAGFIGSIGRAVGRALVELKSLKDLLSSVGRIAKSALANLLGMGAQAGLTALLPGSGSFMSIFKNLAGVPGMAHGGIVTRPTLAMVGEGPESEAILPLSKLKTLMAGAGGGGGTLRAEIEGEKLVFLLDRTRNRMSV